MSVRICSLEDIKPNTSARHDIEDHRLAVVRFEGEELFVVGDECSHADYSLAEGELDIEEKTLECWKHGSTFHLETGEPECLPATRSVTTYEVTVVNGEIMVVLP
jgi:3-phenylpropionate/trans-cinnamate dioxygenase ferredoxin subunit